MTTAWAWIAVAIIMQVAGLVALRASDGFRRRLLAVAAYVGLVGSILPVGRAIESGMSLAVAYSLWTGAGIAFAALAGVLLFDDRLDRTQILGLVLILTGVVDLFQRLCRT